jgi:DNA-binding NarL/FixJ family response regulator
VLRLLLIDDHPLMREGLRAYVGRQPDLEVVGEAADGPDGVARFRELKPDVTVVDLMLPGLSGVQVIAAIRAIDASARLVALTMSGGDIDVRDAIEAGARCFVLKGASGAEVVEAIRAAADGRSYVSQEARDTLALHRNLPLLTPREREILGRVAEGMRNQEIADALGLSLSTVKLHVNAILSKLGAQDRTEAVVLALRRGLLHLA